MRKYWYRTPMRPKLPMSEVNEHFKNHSQGVPSLVVHSSRPWRPYPDSRPLVSVAALVLSASQYQWLNGKEKLLDTFIPHAMCPSAVYQNTHIGIWDTSHLLINYMLLSLCYCSPCVYFPQGSSGERAWLAKAGNLSSLAIIHVMVPKIAIWLLNCSSSQFSKWCPSVYIWLPLQ